MLYLNLDLLEKIADYSELKYHETHKIDLEGITTYNKSIYLVKKQKIADYLQFGDEILYMNFIDFKTCKMKLDNKISSIMGDKDTLKILTKEFHGRNIPFDICKEAKEFLTSDTRL